MPTTRKATPRRRRHPGRRQILVGPYQLPVKISGVDRDLAEEHWYQHERGYVYQRPFINGKRPVRWLHKVIAQRMCGSAKPPKLVRFKNGQQLDCRRQNLIIVRTT